MKRGEVGQEGTWRGEFGENPKINNEAHNGS